MCRVGFGVAANAAFRMSSCLALIVVRGPRRFCIEERASSPAAKSLGPSSFEQVDSLLIVVQAAIIKDLFPVQNVFL